MADKKGEEKHGPMMSVYLAPAETGWVEGIGQGRVKIASIPMAGPYNLEDVVEVDKEALRENPNRVLPGMVISRKYSARAPIFYDKKEQYSKLWHLGKEYGASVEGMIGPSAKAQGFAIVAAFKAEDIQAMVDAIGSEQPEGWEPNTL